LGSVADFHEAKELQGLASLGETALLKEGVSTANTFFAFRLEVVCNGLIFNKASGFEGLAQPTVRISCSAKAATASGKQ
jgi:hypothetical protein